MPEYPLAKSLTKSGGMSFEEWKRRVNAWLYAEAGLESDDLGDWDYAGAYADDVRPSVAGRRALAAHARGSYGID